MKLKNQIICLLCVIAVIIITLFIAGQHHPSLSSPGGHDLNRILVQSQGVIYQNSAALYDDLKSYRIDNPDDVDRIIRMLSSVSCSKSPVREGSKYYSCATHRISFSDCGVVLYIDADNYGVWYDYAPTVSEFNRTGISYDEEGNAYTDIYRIKSRKKLNDLLEMLDRSAEAAEASYSYAYEVYSDSGVKADYITIASGSEDDSPEKIKDMLAGTKCFTLSAGSTEKIRFVMAAGGIAGGRDEINMFNLQPSHGGKRLLDQGVPIDTSKKGLSEPVIGLSWDEEGTTSKYAMFRAVVVEGDILTAQSRLLRDFSESSITEFLPYIGIVNGRIMEIDKHYALINDGYMYYYLFKNGELRKITRVFDTLEYKAISGDYFSALIAQTDNKNGYRGFPECWLYTYNGTEFNKELQYDYLPLETETLTGYNISAMLTDVTVTDRGIDLTFRPAQNNMPGIFPYIKAELAEGKIILQNTKPGGELPEEYDGSGAVEIVSLQEDGDEISLEVELASRRLQYYHIGIQENSEHPDDGSVTVSIKFAYTRGIDAAMD